MKYSALCIGGPLDGLKLDSNYQYLMAPRESKTASVGGTTAHMPDPKNVKYVLKAWNFQPPGKALQQYMFWVPEDKDEGFIVRMLMTTYERKKS